MKNKSALIKFTVVNLLFGFNLDAGFAKTTIKAIPKKTYMDCQTSSSLFKRVVVKAQKKQDVLSQFEVILVNEAGKSLIYSSTDTLDGRFLDPETLNNKHIMIIGRSKDTRQVGGALENATAVSLFENQSKAEDISCLAVQLNAGDDVMIDDKPLKSKQLIIDAKYAKFSGTLHHKNQLIQLSCFSPMIPREGNCDVRTDSKARVEEPEVSSL